MKWVAVVLTVAFGMPAASQEAAAPLVQRFLCEDGMAEDAAFLRLGATDLAILSIHGSDPVLLGLVPSASGAHYTGAGVQWWGKGLEEANLAPLADSEDIASAPGITCRTEG